MNDLDANNAIKYNKNTYIGYLKMKKGGMKIIPGEKDNLIINNRDTILSHLDLVLSGEKKLKEKNIEKYFKALGGKYVRNDICTTGNLKNCERGKNISLGGADKLLKLSARKKFPMEKIINKFKGSAPSLYDNLENKITGGTSEEILAELKEIRSRKKGQSLSKTCEPISMDEGRQLGWVGINMQDEMIGPDCDDEYKGPKEYLNLLTNQTLDVNDRSPSKYEREHPNQGIVRSRGRTGGTNKPTVNENDISESRRNKIPNTYGNEQSGGDALNEFRNEIGRNFVDIELNNLREEINKIRNNS